MYVPGNYLWLQTYCTYLQSLNSSFEEHEEGWVGVNHRLSLQDSFGLQQSCMRIRALQGKERQHHSVVPQEGQPKQKYKTFKPDYFADTFSTAQISKPIYRFSSVFVFCHACIFKNHQANLKNWVKKERKYSFYISIFVKEKSYPNHSKSSLC